MGGRRTYFYGVPTTAASLLSLPIITPPPFHKFLGKSTRAPQCTAQLRVLRLQHDGYQKIQNLKKKNEEKKKF